MHPTPVLLPRKSHGWRSLVGCSPWGRQELDTTEQLPFHFSLSYIGEGNSCLENPRDWGAWWAAISGVAQSRTRLKWLSSSSSEHTSWAMFSLVPHCGTGMEQCKQLSRASLFPYGAPNFLTFPSYTGRLAEQVFPTRASKSYQHRIQMALLTSLGYVSLDKLLTFWSLIFSSTKWKLSLIYNCLIVQWIKWYTADKAFCI